jgi:hypothetical protein
MMVSFYCVFVRRFGKRTTCCAAISLFDDKISGTSVYAGSSTEIPPVTFKKTSLVSQILKPARFSKTAKASFSLLAL